MSKNWYPVLYHCGAYDPAVDSFPVLRSHHHVIFIPASSKPIFRFMQHALYSLWYMSFSERFSPPTRANFFRGSVYLHHLREAFFKEVQDQFYPSPYNSRCQATPTSNKMTRQWFSSILFSWAQVTYYTGRICPPKPSWMPPPLPNNQPVSTNFGECPICAVFLRYQPEHRLVNLVLKS
jgi:hypothetical protein